MYCKYADRCGYGCRAENGSFFCSLLVSARELLCPFFVFHLESWIGGVNDE